MLTQTPPGMRLNKSQAAALLLALPLASCVDAPPTVPSQTEIAPGALGLGATAAPQPQPDWWKAFNDPQLDRLVEQLLASNPTLQGALARIRAAQAELSVARALDYPNINIDGSEQRELLSNDYLYPRPFGGSWQWVGDVQARFRWSLDFWGKQAALIDRARSASTAAALDAGAARLALAGMFAQSYVELLLAYQNIDIAHQTVDERQTILDLTQSRVTAGLENEASLEQAKALLAMARIEVRRAEAQRDMGVHAIAALIGRGADAYPSIVRPPRRWTTPCRCRRPCLPTCWPAAPTFWRRWRGSMRRCGGATPPMPTSIPISISPPPPACRRWVLPTCSAAARSWRMWAPRFICPSSMRGGFAPNTPAPPPIWT